jgi:peptide chain release factor 3
MVIDVAKGVEVRTIKLMEVCRLRDTPILTFINKLDREGKEPIELMDEVETVLNIECAPITWPIGMGKRFKGVVHLLENKIYLYESGKNSEIGENIIINGVQTSINLIVRTSTPLATSIPISAESTAVNVR